mmetsp:Transcript_86810/g.280498  ORF Transcript_86810/g.280498 Transcript_86810/m.280498 type:complete len:248 (-) Transcript_86810:23-766(-)
MYRSRPRTSALHVGCNVQGVQGSAEGLGPIHGGNKDRDRWEPGLQPPDLMLDIRDTVCLECLQVSIGSPPPDLPRRTLLAPAAARRPADAQPALGRRGGLHGEAAALEEGAEGVGGDDLAVQDPDTRALPKVHAVQRVPPRRRQSDSLRSVLRREMALRNLPVRVLQRPLKPLILGARAQELFPSLGQLSRASAVNAVQDLRHLPHRGEPIEQQQRYEGGDEEGLRAGAPHAAERKGEGGRWCRSAG